jgi:hypothetical protein
VKKLLSTLVIACWAGVPSDISAQSCTELPNRPNELWLGAGVLTKAGTQWSELAFEASPGDRFGISLRRTTGGPEEDQGLQAWAVRAGIPFRVSKARFCLFGGFELNDFSFLDRFEVDRGDAQYLTRELGFRAALPIAALNGIEVSAWVAPSVVHMKLEVSGRTLVVDDQISTEERNFGRSEWQFSGQSGVALRWRFLGISGGITKRPALSSGAMGFLRVGVSPIRRDSSSREGP